MTQKKSENRIVLQASGNRGVSQTGSGGGKAIPDNEQIMQLEMPFTTAENLSGKPKRATGGQVKDLAKARRQVVPKVKDSEEEALSATMEEVTKRLRMAFEKVAANKGASGPDRQSIAEVREHLDEILPKLSTNLLDGEYLPGDIRRVYIPKSGGGQRGLGIPNVVDRVVQEAVRMVLEPQYEPTFHPSSHGFRPNRSCHTAITEAAQHISEGYTWVVDIDLEKFFDQVNHQRLMARLKERVEDERVLNLIGRMLKAKVVLPDGVVSTTEEGVPQGGPLSPLLSNVVLDELDQELERRGHRFVRYADDANIYVSSERAGQRVMSSLTRYISRRLRLKVNESKSAVARPEERHFLGFRLSYDPNEGDIEILLSVRTQKQIRERIRELTPRNWGNTLKACIANLNVYLTGWIGFFGRCTAGAERTLQFLDSHIRRRLRAIQLKHWKTKRTIAKRLILLGVQRRTAWRRIYEGRKSLWALSNDAAVNRGLRNAYFAERGLVSLVAKWRVQHDQRAIVAPEQLTLF